MPLRLRQMPVSWLFCVIERKRSACVVRVVQPWPESSPCSGAKKLERRPREMRTGRPTAQECYTIFIRTRLQLRALFRTSRHEMYWRLGNAECNTQYLGERGDLFWMRYEMKTHIRRAPFPGWNPGMRTQRQSRVWTRRDLLTGSHIAVHRLRNLSPSI